MKFDRHQLVFSEIPDVILIDYDYNFMVIMTLTARCDNQLYGSKHCR